MIVVMLMMIVSGIGLALTVSRPQLVTPAWLRLGGVIALVLLAVAFVLGRASGDRSARAIQFVHLFTALLFAAQVIAAQQGRGGTQRALAFGGWLAAAFIAMNLVLRSTLPSAAFGAVDAGFKLAATAAATLVGGGLLGCVLLTMLLGHAYLSSGDRMTQRPFGNLVVLFAVLLALRAALAIVGAVHYFSGAEPHGAHVWDVTMIVARFGVGLLVPGVFTWMIHDCVRRAANQSATGILYVTLILVFIGEGAALTLMKSTGLAF
jgi:hypothetical protein